MVEVALAEGQYAIGSGENDLSALVYGAGAGDIYVQNTATDTGTINVQDQAVTGHDGLLFGIDTLPGMVITQTGLAYTEPGQGDLAMDAYSALAGKWNDPAVRLSDNTVQVLRAWYPGSSVIRRAYGRGRKIMPTMGLVFQGLVPFTAQFQAADNTWYSDESYSVTLSLVPALPGTLTPPLTPPYQLASQNNAQQFTAVNTGSLPTWPYIEFFGPVTNPSISYVNTPVSIGYQGTIKAGQAVAIDTRPWYRNALITGNASVAGQLTGDAMISMQLQPGSTQVKYNGQDPTGSSVCMITWRNATLAIGGSF